MDVTGKKLLKEQTEDTISKTYLQPIRVTIQRGIVNQ